ncbi:MAG: SAM-dependent methyltransferase [Deltaproteobacteria bacterium RBG_13_53_10]|nr:MAG: SAM-dependent methyltransferase [Deltaproteobacteria bacterium RBG_13_53_10]
MIAERPDGPVLDLASGDGHNGLFLAAKGLPVILADRSDEALSRAKEKTDRIQGKVTIWKTDLERAGENPLKEAEYSAILVFRFLHRPLMPCIRKALRTGGFLVYYTYTVDQAQFGKPRNPDFLLKPGELINWFKDWHVLHHFEGIQENPRRAIAEIVCRKPRDRILELTNSGIKEFNS